MLTILIVAALLVGVSVAADTTVGAVPSARAAVYPTTSYPIPSPVPQDAFGFSGMRMLTSVAAPQTFFAYTAADESVAFVFDKIANVNRRIEIRVTSPSGTIYSMMIPSSGQTNRLYGFGAGALPKEEGIWTAELIPESGELANQNAELFTYSAVYGPGTGGTLTVEKPGRIWTNTLYLYQPTNGSTFTVWEMSSLGYIYEVTYHDYWGLNSGISVDGVGNVARNPDGTPNCSVSVYRSVTGADTRVSPADPDAMRANGACGSVYRIFFSPPYQEDEAAVIPSATSHAGASPNDWVRPTIEPPSFELTDYVGTSTSSAAGSLLADVDNFFGSVVVEVLDRDGNTVRTFTVNVPEGDGLREVTLPFDGLDDAGNPIPPGNITTFRVRGLNAGEIHFVGSDVESITGGVEVRALNGPVSGTAESTRVYWADSDGFDGAPAQAGVNTRDEGVLSDGGVRGYTYSRARTSNSSPFPSGTIFGDGMHTEMWARQGIANQSTLTLHDPVAEYTMVKSVSPARAVVPGESVTFTVTVTNVSDVDLWDLWAFDDLSGVLDDADYAGDAVLTGSWGRRAPSPGAAVFHSAAGRLDLRLNVPAHAAVTVTYSAIVRSDDADRGNDVLSNRVAAVEGMPPPTPCPDGAPRCRETDTPVKDLRLNKVLAAQPVQHANGSWSVEYLLTARNLGALTENVTVSDALRFGAGITTLAASATAEGAMTPEAVTPWDGAAQQTVYTGPIPAGATYTYRVAVDASVAAGVVGTAPGMCTAAASSAGGFHNAASLASPAVPAVALTADACAAPARPAMQKALVGFSQNTDGSWNLSYRILVSNASASQLSYDLVDGLHFGPGSTIRSAVVSHAPGGVTLATPGWDGIANTAIATGVTLPPATDAGPTVHEYTLDVTAEIDPGGGLGTPGWQCPGAVSTADQAFNNLATLTSGSETIDDNACGEPTSPTMTKAVDGPAVQQPDGTWTLSYLITVTNSAESPAGGLMYALSDVFSFPGDTTINSVDVAGPAGVTINPGFNGGLSTLGGSSVAPDANLLAEESIIVPAATAAGPTRHEYLITVNAHVPAGMAMADRSCDAGAATGDGGFSNTARLTGSGIDTASQDCTDVPDVPGTIVEKTVVSSIQATDGSWDVVYAIDVRDESATVAAIYDLDDTLAYGAGISVNAVSVTRKPAGVALAAPAWDGIGTTRIATGVVIAGGDVHHYEVTVNAAPSRAVYDGDSRLCAADGGPAAGGFLNTVQTRSGAAVRDADACASIPAPRLELDKQVEGEPASVEVGDTVNYVITATNVGGADYSAAVPADVVDDLRDVLDNADYRGHASATLPGTVAFVQPRLSWTGPLRVGESVTIRYAVRVTSLGDTELVNTVASPLSCPDCEATTRTPVLRPQTPLPVPPLAVTGGTSTLFAISAAGLAILLGAMGVFAAAGGHRRARSV